MGNAENMGIVKYRSVFIIKRFLENLFLMKLGCADLSFFSARDNSQTPKMTDATDDELAVKRQDDVKTVERGIERIEIAKVEKPEKPPRTEKKRTQKQEYFEIEAARHAHAAL